MEQTVLPFKLESTHDCITPHAGLALFGEFLHGLQLTTMIDSRLRAPGSGAGHAPSEFVAPLRLMLHGGGRALEDWRELRADAGLRQLLGLGRIPSADAVGDWLRRMGAGRGLGDLG